MRRTSRAAAMKETDLVGVVGKRKSFIYGDSDMVVTEFYTVDKSTGLICRTPLI